LNLEDKNFEKMPKDYFNKMIKDADTNGDGEAYFIIVII